MQWNLDNAKNGLLTIKVVNKNQAFYIHSKYNPDIEAQRWSQRLEKGNNIDKIVVIGMGLGYHIEKLRDIFPSTTIEVWELNNRYKLWLESLEQVKRLTAKKSVLFKSSEDILEINDDLLEKVKSQNTELIIHKPSLLLIPDKLKFIKEKLEDIYFIKQSYLDKKDLLKLNFENNVKLMDEGINNQFNKYNNKPFLLVSAGPSLTKQLPILKKIRIANKVVIGCVGTALKPLLANDIIPDFLMVSDPLDNIYQQIEGLNTNNLILFYLSTANHKTISSFAGKRFIVWQADYSFARERANFKREPLIETGGSVATCLLDLMVKMGASLIALVGQDFAFTDGKSHAESAAGYRKIQNDSTIIEVENYNLTGKVTTSKNLSIYLKWFENYIKNKDFVEFWNCTEGGAHIKGWKHIPLMDFCNIIS